MVETGVMIALYLPEAAAGELFHQLAPQLVTQGVEIVPQAQYHVTLCMLGDIGELPPGTARAAVGACADISYAFGPVGARINGGGVFLETHRPGMAAHYMNFDAPGLFELRCNLVAALAASGAQINRDHGFTPHITIAYADNTRDVSLEFLPFSLVCDALTLAIGDEHLGFLLGGDRAARGVQNEAV